MTATARPARIALAEHLSQAHLLAMKNSATSRSRALPRLYGELALASWETILHRTLMMASGRCSIDEYQRMVTEKSEALQHSAVAWMTGGSERAVLAPFHSKARANAKRLRGKAGVFSGK